MTGSAATLFALARNVPGPLAIAGFFLPWAHGSGPLSGTEFSGYRLVRFTGALQQLDLTWSEGGALWAVRIAIVLVPVAGAWQTLLAPAHRWHPAYAASGWYLVLFAAVAVGIGLSRSGLGSPAPGVALIAASAAVFVVSNAPGMVRTTRGR